jgi:hypothetical protein
MRCSEMPATHYMFAANRSKADSECWRLRLRHAPMRPTAGFDSKTFALAGMAGQGGTGQTEVTLFAGAPQAFFWLGGGSSKATKTLNSSNTYQTKPHTAPAGHEYS